MVGQIDVIETRTTISNHEEEDDEKTHSHTRSHADDIN